ncbi:TPA: hypothetical protein ACX6QF_000055 [Photobacterium damselae]|uniref:hypothetical protein n=1 Tax=Photobacterium damselae TaxID=38293 RepID=UPI001F2F32C8|nr:hypothetical protein [Photobacterium damselae]UKA08956.1 hypothetical protein IHC91_07895 [Photobacterium damselae subsp. damselae]
MIIEKLEHNEQQYFNITVDDALSFGVPLSVINLAVLIQTNKNVIDTRRKVYGIESDPLFLEWQYDQTSEKEQAWRDKVAEIKTRYPLPTKE